MASIIINDFLENKRIKLFFLPDDYEVVDSQWEETDPLLQHLKGLAFFAGAERWCDLIPAQYRLLVAKSLQTAALLAEEDRVDDENPVVSSLNFLICALLRCIERLNDCHVEHMTINRVGDLEISVEFGAALRMEASDPEPQPQKKIDPFSVVVDNTKPE